MSKPKKYGLVIFSLLIFSSFYHLPSAVALLKRPSITFIIGEDKGSKNIFFTRAAYYYTHNLQEQTDYVVTSLRSLIEIRNYLETLSIETATPWGVINIVGHSNEWTGLSIPLFPEGRRTTVKSLQDAVDKKKFQPLPDSVVDEKTEIRIVGCALGKDVDFLRVFSKAYGGDDVKQPVVRSCRYFICFDAKEENGHIVECIQYLADYWFAFYRKGYRPGDIRLARQLKQRYPDVKNDWRGALKRTKPRFMGDAFHYTYNVPIKWIVVYSDAASCPDMTTKEGQHQWLRNQKELHHYIADLGIPAKYFEWHIKNIKYGIPDGTLKPAIRASGKCTVLCVLKAVAEPDPLNPNRARPLMPSFSDPLYFGSGNDAGGVL